jgi:hypothetical protein
MRLITLLFLILLSTCVRAQVINTLPTIDDPRDTDRTGTYTRGFAAAFRLDTLRKYFSANIVDGINVNPNVSIPDSLRGRFFTSTLDSIYYVDYFGRFTNLTDTQRDEKWEDETGGISRDGLVRIGSSGVALSPVHVEKPVSNSSPIAYFQNSNTSARSSFLRISRGGTRPGYWDMGVGTSGTTSERFVWEWMDKPLLSLDTLGRLGINTLGPLFDIDVLGDSRFQDIRLDKSPAQYELARAANTDGDLEFWTPNYREFSDSSNQFLRPALPYYSLIHNLGNYVNPEMYGRYGWLPTGNFREAVNSTNVSFHQPEVYGSFENPINSVSILYNHSDYPVFGQVQVMYHTLTIAPNFPDNTLIIGTYRANEVNRIELVMESPTHVVATINEGGTRSAAAQTGDPYILIFLEGQSNAVGVGDASDLPTEYSNAQDSVFIMPRTGGAFTALDPGTNSNGAGGAAFGVESKLGRDLAREYGYQVYIVKTAVGGTGIYHTGGSADQDWNVGSSELALDATKNRLQAFQLLANRPCFLSATIWIQGEEDSKFGIKGIVYPENFQALKGITDGQMQSFPHKWYSARTKQDLTETYNYLVRETQVTYSDGWADMDDLPTTDGTHVNSTGLQTMSDRFLALITSGAYTLHTSPGWSASSKGSSTDITMNGDGNATPLSVDTSLIATQHDLANYSDADWEIDGANINRATGKVAIGGTDYKGALNVTGNIGIDAGVRNYIFGANGNASATTFQDVFSTGASNLLGPSSASYSSVMGTSNLRFGTGSVSYTMAVGSSNGWNGNTVNHSLLIGQSNGQTATDISFSTLLGRNVFSGATGVYFSFGQGDRLARNATKVENSFLLGDRAGDGITGIIEDSYFSGYLAGEGAADGTDVFAHGYLAARNTTFSDFLVIGRSANPAVDGHAIFGTSANNTTRFTSRNYNFNVDQDLTGKDGFNLTYNNTSGEIELVADNIGTDDQDLSLAGNTLSLTNDATTVDLSGYLDNTDTQLTESQVDAFANNNGYLTAEVDGSITNEIQTIDVATFDGTDLNLSLSGDGEATKVIDLSSLKDGPTRVTRTSNLTRTSASVATDASLTTASLGSGLYKFKAVLVYRGSDTDTDLEYEIERIYSLSDFSMSRSNDATSVRGLQGYPYDADVSSTTTTGTHTVIIEGTFYNSVGGNTIKIDWGGTDAVGSITMVRGSYLETQKID